MIRDPDGIYGEAFCRRLKGIGGKDVPDMGDQVDPTSVAAPGAVRLCEDRACSTCSRQEDTELILPMVGFPGRKRADLQPESKIAAGGQ
jgi:hypothetical protein